MKITPKSIIGSLLIFAGGTICGVVAGGWGVLGACLVVAGSTVKATD